MGEEEEAEAAERQPGKRVSTGVLLMQIGGTLGNLSRDTQASKHALIRFAPLPPLCMAGQQRPSIPFLLTCNATTTTETTALAGTDRLQPAFVCSIVDEG